MELGDYRTKIIGFGGPQQVKLPHLHRVDPAGGFLGTWDGEKDVLRVRNLGTKTSRTVRISGFKGKVNSFRWLSDSRGFVFKTDKNLYHVAYNAESGGKRASAKPLFDNEAVFIEDFRILDGGVAIRTGYSKRKQLRYRLFFVRNDAATQTIDLTPPQGELGSMNVRSGGRIVAVVRNLPRSGKKRYVSTEFWTWSTRDAAMPSVVEQQPCLDQYCGVVNWTPNTNKLVYALSGGRIVIQDGDNRRVLKLENVGFSTQVHTLWFDKDEKRLLAATNDVVKAWDADGKVLWSWARQDARGKIRSAHFHPNGGILVTTDKQVLRLQNGKVADVLISGNKKERNAYYEDAIPLADGSIAFSRVVHKSHYEYHRRERIMPRPRLLKLKRAKQNGYDKLFDPQLNTIPLPTP